MRIAVASQNRKTVTGHAGRTRRFSVWDVRPGAEPVQGAWIELPKELAFHEFHGEGPHPIDGVDVLIVGGAGPGFVRRLAARGVTVVQCPNCHMKLGMGVTPVPALLSKGVNVALDTDGTASSNDLNMLKEARLAALIQRLHHGDPEMMAGDLPLRMVRASVRARPESPSVVRRSRFHFTQEHARRRAGPTSSSSPLSATMSGPWAEAVRSRAAPSS